MTKPNLTSIITYRFPMIYDRNITGMEAQFICDFRFSIFESKSELPNLSGINRLTDGTTASRARRTALQPLHTSKTTLLSELLCAKLAFFTSKNKKKAQPNFSLIWQSELLWRLGRKGLLVSISELCCPIAITNLNFHLYYRLSGRICQGEKL